MELVRKTRSGGRWCGGTKGGDAREAAAAATGAREAAAADGGGARGRAAGDAVIIRLGQELLKLVNFVPKKGQI